LSAAFDLDFRCEGVLGPANRTGTSACILKSTSKAADKSVRPTPATRKI
jgi:hypothetical protein